MDSLVQPDYIHQQMISVGLIDNIDDNEVDASVDAKRIDILNAGNKLIVTNHNIVCYS